MISVVIACRDAAPWIEAAIASALDQREVGEVIVVDDGSSDGSAEGVAAMAGADPRIVALEGPGTGPAAARNIGIAAARGDWVAILDADDAFLPGRLAALLAAAGDADLVADDLLLFGDGHEARPLIGMPPAVPPAITPARFLASRLFGPGPNLGYLKPMIRMDALVRTGIRYDESLRIGEDDDLVARLLAAGCRYQLLPRPLYRYRRHAGSLSHRLRVADLDALAAAHARTARRFDPADRILTRLLRRRAAAIASARRFQLAVDALRQRRPLAAAVALKGDVRALALFRHPLAARLRPAPRPIPCGASVPLAAITVCVCTYRRASIRDTLASLAAQQGVGALRVIVADNDDDTRARASIGAAAAGLSLRYVHAPARNIAVARNAALAAVETRWAAFLDDDGIARPDWLARLAEGAADHQAVIGRTQALYPVDLPRWVRRADFHSNRATGRPDNGHTASALIDVAFARAHGVAFETGLGAIGGEDTLFFAGIAAAGGRIATNPDAVVEEPVARERATIAWVLRRRFRAGRTHGWMLAAFHPRAHRRLAATAAAKAFAAAIASLVTRPGSVASRRWLARAALHAGAWAAAVRAETAANPGGRAAARSCRGTRGR